MIMQDNESLIISTIKKMGKVRFTDLKTKLVDKEKLMSEPTLSKHLKLLEAKGELIKINDEKDPSIIYYAIKRDRDIKSTFKEIKTKSKLTIELGRTLITNYGFDSENPINSSVEILLRISNPTKEMIGIRKILVRSHEKNYPIAILIEDMDIGKTISSFTLNPEETRLIRLFDNGLPTISIDKKYITANVEIYGTRDNIIEKLPVKLFIGYSMMTE